jgi:hypothetical protein
MYVCVYVCFTPTAVHETNLYVCNDVCMCVCVCFTPTAVYETNLYVCMYVCVYASRPLLFMRPTCMYACMYVCVYVCMYASRPLLFMRLTCMYICMYACVYECAASSCIQTYIYTRVNFTHTHIYTRTRTSISRNFDSASARASLCRDISLQRYIHTYIKMYLHFTQFRLRLSTCISLQCLCSKLPFAHRFAQILHSFLLKLVYVCMH